MSMLCVRRFGIFTCRRKSVFVLRVNAVLLCGFVTSCFVDSVCYNNADCPSDKACSIAHGESHGSCKNMCFDNADCGTGYLCDPATSLCRKADCVDDDDCDKEYTCDQGVCVAALPLQCPLGMVAIENQFCIDIYEASRPDATETSSGSDGSIALSRSGVMPWWVTDNAEAESACLAAGKNLCTESQWFQACRGPKKTVYAYGDNYEAATCNGIDAFCKCGQDSPCADRDPCPFAGCRSECGSDFMLKPTGSFAGCHNDYGVYDMNGNMWEHVLGGDKHRIRGGAFNCSDSKQLHRCDYIPGNWEPDAEGFRCCSAGLVGGDAGTEATVDDGES